MINASKTSRICVRFDVICGDYSYFNHFDIKNNTQLDGG